MLYVIGLGDNKAGVFFFFFLTRAQSTSVYDVTRGKGVAQVSWFATPGISVPATLDSERNDNCIDFTMILYVCVFFFLVLAI